MRTLRRAYRIPLISFVFVVGATLSLALQGSAPAATTPAASSAAAATAHATTAHAAAAAAVSPDKTGELDCHGLSPVQKPAKGAVMCLDPRALKGWDGRFYENGHYIGHDEPSVRFISSRPGSGAFESFTERLPVEPRKLPTVRHPGRDVTHTFELTVAPWFSTTVCDPDSTPMNPCKPVSDANAPRGSYTGAGAAFVELQFYPPGFAPFSDNISCDNTHWCSALTIDSLECKGSGNNVSDCNPNCTEPVNFGFIQTNGVPTGPPSPQLSDQATFTPNGNTLLMNQGDVINATMFNARLPGGQHALEARLTDFTTHQSGYMIASAANGFMNTNPANCDGTPFSFQPEYSSAAPQNIIPWGPGPYMINDQYEVGHFEPCTSLSGKVTATGDTYYNNCIGPYETSAEDPALEPNDAPCYPFGDTHGGTAAPNLVTGCDVFDNAIGDLDYDGTPYYPDWPNSVRPDKYPSTFQQLQPVTAGGHYPKIQFVTDNSATQLNTGCNTVTGQNCVLPPKGPGHFYPYFTQARVGGACVWEFGNMRNGNTFGGDAQYGSVTPATLGAFAGPIMANPECGHRGKK